MRIILKGFIPPTINKYIGRTNIFDYQREKRKVHKIVLMSTIGNNPKIKKCNITITYYFPDRRKHDPSNYDKMLLDGLIYASIITDDNYDVIKKFTTIGEYDKDNPRTEIDIEELE